jgi:hypothetical protein
MRNVVPKNRIQDSDIAKYIASLSKQNHVLIKTQDGFFQQQRRSRRRGAAFSSCRARATPANAPRVAAGRWNLAVAVRVGPAAVSAKDRPALSDTMAACAAGLFHLEMERHRADEELRDGAGAGRD